MLLQHFNLWFSQRGSREKGRKVDKNSHSRREMTEESPEPAAAGSSREDAFPARAPLPLQTAGGIPSLSSRTL